MSVVRVSRRAALAAGTALLAAPAVLRAQPAAVKIGLIHPVTGPLADAGIACRYGNQLAAEDINAAGGLRGLGGAKIEHLLGDAQSRPEVAVSEVEKMAEQGVVGICGAFASAIVLAASQAAAKYNIPFSVDSGISDTIVSRGLANVFRWSPGNSGTVDNAMTALRAINAKAGGVAKSAIVVHEEGEFGTNTARLLAGRLPQIGIEVKQAIPHATPTRDFTNVALRIRAERPDLVVMSNYQNEYRLLARTLVQQRVEVGGLFSISGGGFGLAFIKESPQAAQWMMDFNHWYNPRDPKAQAFRQRVEANGRTMRWEFLLGYYATRVLADAIDRAGSTDKERIIAAMAASTFSDHFMPYGPTRFVNGQNTGASGVLLQALDGDMEVVWPDEFASKPAVFPRPKA